MRYRYTFFALFAVLLFGAGCTSEPVDDYAADMAEQHEHDTTEASPMAAEPSVAVDTSSVTYWSADGQTAVGYMAVPADADSELPAVIVIHEWWGLNDNIKTVTRRLAGEGYRALAVDLYGGQVASQSDQAQQLVQEALQNQSALKENVTAAYRYLAQEQNAPRVGVIGWCFGGAMSLQTALALPDEIDATIIYYGPMVDDRAALETLEMPILAFFGAEDESIPLDQVQAFEQTLNELDKDVEIHVYEDAGHAFANPTGNNYVEQAAQDSWMRTVAFFGEHLAGSGG